MGATARSVKAFVFAICAALGLFCGLPEAAARSPADCANAAAAPAGAVQVRRAFATCSRALARGALDDEQRAEVLRLRGNVSRLAGAFERSIADLTAAKQLRPGNPLVARALALSLIEGGKVPEAEREIERALLLEPSLQGFLLRCMIYTEAGRPADGITDCEAVHQVDPSEESAFLAARAYAKLGRVRDAIAVLERAIATRNGSPRVRNLLAEVRGFIRFSESSEPQCGSELSMRRSRRAAFAASPSGQCRESELPLGGIRTQSPATNASRR